MNTRFIVVDDDFGTNQYCSILLKKLVPGVTVNVFMVPEDAINYIKSVYTEADFDNTILLLDINMPGMTGWQFLELFEEYEDTVKKQISIYIFSSSVDPHDKERAKQNKRIVGYLEKPLTKEMIGKLCPAP